MGNTNGVLTEVSRKRVNNRTVVLVSCSCGEVREKRSDALAACKWTCTHCPFTESLRNLRAYSSWDSMKQRCTNPNNPRGLPKGEHGVRWSVRRSRQEW